MIYAVNKLTGRHRIHRDGEPTEWEEVLVPADADGWIEWHGGEFPLPDGERFDAKLRRKVIRSNLGVWDWEHLGIPSDITAYRPILKQEQQMTTTAHEWRGPEDGLPPVGIECIYMGDEKRKGKITHHMQSGYAAVIEYEHGGYDTGGKHDFKAIRTDRERWIEAAKEVVSNSNAFLVDEYEAIHDALQRGDLPMPEGL